MMMQSQTNPSTLEESIIRSLNEKYKDFTVDEEEDGKRVPFGGLDWDALKTTTPRRSQSWLCCPTIYKRDSQDPSLDAKVAKDDLHISSLITEGPKFNPHHDPLQLQTAGLSALRSEIMDLSQRLQRSEHGRHIVEQQLRDAFHERERTSRHLEALAATHESRITEMHCIIVELSQKLKTKEEGVIAEEPEGSGKND